MKDVTPKQRAAIIRSVGTTGMWGGTLHGAKLEVRLSPQPDLEGRRVKWSARYHWRKYGGWARTVFDALAMAIDEIRRDQAT